MLDLTRYRMPDDFPGVPLPSWIQIDDRWNTQVEVAKEIVRAFEENDIVFLQAPTGAGKSLIGELVRRMMVARALYTCSTKALQDQFERTFPYAKVLKGRTNYLTLSGSINEFGHKVSPSHVTCKDCTWDPDSAECKWCDNRTLCPYILARSQAESASLAVLNTSYLLTDLNKGRGRFAGRDLIVIDEADVLESELLNNVEVYISNSRMDKLGLAPPKRKTVEKSWSHWANEVALPKIRTYLDNLPNPSVREDLSLGEIREYDRTVNLVTQMMVLAKELPEGGWVYDGYNNGDVIFRPVRVDKYGERYIWDHGAENGKWLLMSATILSGDIMVDSLGISYITGRNYTTIDLPSTFPVANRPIHVAPIADMSFKNKATAWPSMLHGIRGVLALHPHERVLIHTVSYELARFLAAGLDNSGRPIVTYYGSQHKEAALRKHGEHIGSVLIAASMDRGIDLPDELCRVQIVAKIPWPNTSDKRTAARMYQRGGQDWYRMNAVRSLVQMTGRGVRSPTDHAVTYILDGQFGSNLWQQGKYLFPKWWSEALNFRFNMRKIR